MALRLGQAWISLPLLDQVIGVIIFLLFQTPCYMCTWLASIMRLPWVLYIGRRPTDEDVIDWIENTVLFMLVKNVPGGGVGLRRFEVPGSCRLLMQGKRLESFSILYTSARGTEVSSMHPRTTSPQILACQRNGKPVTSREQIFSTLFLYHVLSFHPKSHNLANELVQRLGTAWKQGSCGPLAPCTYNTVTLHVFLLHTPFSPISQSKLSKLLLFDSGVTVASLLAESTNMAALNGHENLAEHLLSAGTPVTRFLYGSRAALLRVMQAHGISMDMVPFEALWLHTVAHAMDHVAATRLLFSSVPLLVSMDPWGEGTAWDLANGYVFARLFVVPMVSPLPWASNRLRHLARGYSFLARLGPMEQSFWRDLYTELQQLDPELAAEVTASIMY